MTSLVHRASKSQLTLTSFMSPAGEVHSDTPAIIPEKDTKTDPLSLSAICDFLENTLCP